MQIVIKIDEKDYQSLKEGHIPFNVLAVIRKGIILPERHGRLIDADRVIKKMEEREEKLKDDRSIWETAGVETALNMFGETIIEAESEDK